MTVVQRASAAMRRDYGSVPSVPPEALEGELHRLDCALADVQSELAALRTLPRPTAGDISLIAAEVFSDP